MTPRPSVEPGTNVLLMGPSLSSERQSRCLDLLAPAELDALDVLRVAYSDAPSTLVQQWRDHHGRLPERTGIVFVGDRAAVAGAEEDLPSDVVVTSANPNDLTGLGMRLNNYLNDATDGQLVVCFDSLTELLQFADVQAAFKFLHMLTGQFRDADAIAHFHVDPDAHDRKTISKLKPAFDEAIRIE
jgi:KaiC/GvpD/RAD55 family RecA-like ATPase